MVFSSQFVKPLEVTLLRQLLDLDFIKPKVKLSASTKISSSLIETSPEDCSAIFIMLIPMDYPKHFHEFACFTNKPIVR